MLTDLGNNPYMDLKNMETENLYAMPYRKAKRGRADLPYPEIYIRQKDPRYLKLLLDLYMGKDGEFTSSCQYIYQSCILSGDFFDVKEALNDIVRTEMRHFSMLGNMIAQLGGDPRYWFFQDRRYKMWDGNHVRYTKNIKKMLLENIEAEMNGIRNLRSAIDAIEDEDITYILQRVKMDEETHLKMFTDLFEKYK
jgi:bacterioferritin